MDIVYMITGGHSLKNFHKLVCHGCRDIKLTYFIMMFASVHFLLSPLPSFNSISLVAAVMSLRYYYYTYIFSVSVSFQELSSIIALCYLPVAIIGYWMFGNSVKENILGTPRWLIAMANMFHLIGSYQIYAIPVFDMMESVLGICVFLQGLLMLVCKTALNLAWKC